MNLASFALKGDLQERRNGGRKVKKQGRRTGRKEGMEGGKVGREGGKDRNR